VKPEIVLTK